MPQFFAGLDENDNLLEILRKFLKILKYFLQKIAKNALFMHIFQKKLTNHALIFCAFGLKRQFIGNFEKISENFEKFSSENCKKCIILAYFSNKLTNYAFILCAFRRIRKIEFFIFLFLFFIFFENLLLKIELSEITPFFYNNFFGFVGENFPPFPPWLRPWLVSQILEHSGLR